MNAQPVSTASGLADDADGEPDSGPAPFYEDFAPDGDPADDLEADPAASGGAACAAPCARPSPCAPEIGELQLNGWLAAVVQHDERALTALYDATMPRVYGIVLRIVRKAALAEEVVEETYFQVWRQALRFDPARGPAWAWLLGMARSRAIDTLRREARFQHDSLDLESAPDLPDHRPAADELLDIAREHADLHQALMLLNAQPRQLVAMAFFKGLSHEEIASETCLPLGTVKSQIRRALISLRQTLGEGCLNGMGRIVRAAVPAVAQAGLRH
jgi:RNA polymerase sigma-70 factor (ECF subfamily)